jgi:hypothetical protein
MSKNFIAAVAAVALAGPAAADQLVFSAEKAGGARVAALDYVSEGTATAFEFRINVPGGDAASVDLSRCVSSLPKSHVGQCSFVKGQIIGIVYSDTNELLPKGVLPIGQISVVTKAVGDLSVALFNAVDKAGESISSTVADAATK